MESVPPFPADPARATARNQNDGTRAIAPGVADADASAGDDWRSALTGRLREQLLDLLEQL